MRSFKRARARSVQHTRSTEEIARTYTLQSWSGKLGADEGWASEADAAVSTVEALTTQVGTAFFTFVQRLVR